MINNLIVATAVHVHNVKSRVNKSRLWHFSAISVYLTLTLECLKILTGLTKYM